MRLDEAVARHAVTWHWVKGHAGHPENERADRLARMQDALARTEREGTQTRGPKAIALHQAALLVDPENYRAANPKIRSDVELGH